MQFITVEERTIKALLGYELDILVPLVVAYPGRLRHVVITLSWLSTLHIAYPRPTDREE
jgi:hypothetical protein